MISAGGHPAYAHSSGYTSSRSNSSSSFLPGTTRSRSSSLRFEQKPSVKLNHSWHGSHSSSGAATPTCESTISSCCSQALTWELLRCLHQSSCRRSTSQRFPPYAPSPGYHSFTQCTYLLRRALHSLHPHSS